MKIKADIIGELDFLLSSKLDTDMLDIVGSANSSFSIYGAILWADPGAMRVLGDLNNIGKARQK